MAQLTSREQYAKTLFFPKLMDEEASEVLVKRISSIGDRFGFVGNQGDDERRKHKYDIWIATQVRKELVSSSGSTILDREGDLFMILDWAIETRPNLTAIDFNEAFELQRAWLGQLKRKGVIRPIPIDNERIIFRCTSGRFLYLLKSEDLPYEGLKMSNCVGGQNFQNKVNNNRSIIISLRDQNNAPHVTVEVAIMKGGDGKPVGTVVQQYGKGNKDPIDDYHLDLKEFALFSIRGGDGEEPVLPPEPK